MKDSDQINKTDKVSDELTTKASAFDTVARMTADVNRFTTKGSAFDMAARVSADLNRFATKGSAFDTVARMTADLNKFTTKGSAFDTVARMTADLNKFTTKGNAFDTVARMTADLNKFTIKGSAFDTVARMTADLNKFTIKGSAFDTVARMTADLNKFTTKGSAFDTVARMTADLNKFTTKGSAFDTVARMTADLNKFTIKGSAFDTVAKMSASLNNLNTILEKEISYNDKNKFENKEPEVINSALNIDLNRLYFLIADLNKKIDKIKKPSFISSLATWVTILGFIIMLYQWEQKIADDSNPQKIPASKRQVEELHNEFNKAFKENINNYAIERRANFRCRIFLKPSFRSVVLTNIKRGEKLSVLNTNKRWALVICLDQDGLPVTGWVLKKCLSRVKK